jgi:hypothetical protein
MVSYLVVHPYVILMTILTASIAFTYPGPSIVLVYIGLVLYAVSLLKYIVSKARYLFLISKGGIYYPFSHKRPLVIQYQLYQICSGTAPGAFVVVSFIAIHTSANSISYHRIILYSRGTTPLS